jgi:hypothetical protein
MKNSPDGCRLILLSFLLGAMFFRKQEAKCYRLQWAGQEKRQDLRSGAQAVNPPFYAYPMLGLLSPMLPIFDMMVFPHQTSPPAS